MALVADLALVIKRLLWGSHDILLSIVSPKVNISSEVFDAIDLCELISKFSLSEEYFLLGLCVVQFSNPGDN